MWKLLRKPLFLLPAEPAHRLGMDFLRMLSKATPASRVFRHSFHYQINKTAPHFLNTANPIGLAAGLDKNCEILEMLPYFGFGYAEIGTVTPKPQGGNDKPRLFRKVETESIFNRMGFNNLGAGIVSERLRKAKTKLPKQFKVGVNLGKNKNTLDSDAANDYATVARAFLDCADYFVINVSSPNTPGLRALQSIESLIPIVQAVQNVVSPQAIPILVKLAPELAAPHQKEEFMALIQALERQKIDGLVLTNTLQGDYIYRGRTMSGGWSGLCLKDMSFEALKHARSLTSMPIISVGGINSAEEVKKRLDAGANLVQIYSAWIYEGPFLIRKILSELA